MLRDVLHFFFDHLFAWDHTADVLIRLLGPGVLGKGANFSRDTVTQHVDNKKSFHSRDPLQRTTPSHAAELSLKALLGPEEQQLWPARPTFHKTWPAQLQAYQQVYEALGPHLVNEWPSLDDAENRQIIDNFRARVRRELSTHIQTTEVQTLLKDERCMSGPAWQGFYACIAYLRHYYRWGVSPIVHIAQQEKTLEIPEELEVPWRVLQRHFRINGQGGNMTSNEYFAFNERQKHEFSCCWGLSEDHLRTEHWTGYLFVGMEQLAVPMYHHMAQAVASVHAGDLDGAVGPLQAANSQLKEVFKYFYKEFNRENLVFKLLVPYVQGFHGWTLDGENGASGDQSLTIRTLDAFLGIRPLQTPEVEALLLPGLQRDWINSLRDFDIRARSTSSPQVLAELEHMLKQLRTWRMGHMRKMQPYEVIVMPERKSQTAGLSMPGDERAPDNVGMVKHLLDFLMQRLADTK